jgi:hypothetical protein
VKTSRHKTDSGWSYLSCDSSIVHLAPLNMFFLSSLLSSTNNNTPSTLGTIIAYLPFRLSSLQTLWSLLESRFCLFGLIVCSRTKLEHPVAPWPTLSPAWVPVSFPLYEIHVVVNKRTPSLVILTYSDESLLLSTSLAQRTTPAPTYGVG